MAFPGFIWGLLALSLALNAMGFKKYIWFFSIGYGLAVAGLSAAMMIWAGPALTPGTTLCCALLAVYGLRLGGYLAYREVRLGSYNRSMKGEIKDTKSMPMMVKVVIWVVCAILYVTMVSPLFYRLVNKSADNFWVWLGAGLIALGFIMEVAADAHKSMAKKKNPGRYVSTGLYRLVRCPNYLGELLLWTGVFLSGMGALSGIGQWIVAVLGLVGIWFVMFSGARRLELRQNRVYGNDPEYQKYVKSVPILLPFLPLYSVEKHKWLVA